MSFSSRFLSEVLELLRARVRGGGSVAIEDLFSEGID